jgi:hypothetical protein
MFQTNPGAKRTSQSERVKTQSGQPLAPRVIQDHPVIVTEPEQNHFRTTEVSPCSPFPRTNNIRHAHVHGTFLDLDCIG